jgi:uncharacterized protein
MRAVVDTNVFVSALMLPASSPGRVVAAGLGSAFTVDLSEPILEEIRAALFYPKVRKRIALSDGELDRFIDILRYVAEVVDPAGQDVHVPGDSDDDAILATLIAARADWLITGDSALLALAGRYPIIAPAEFAARHL